MLLSFIFFRFIFLIENFIITNIFTIIKDVPYEFLFVIYIINLNLINYLSHRYILEYPIFTFILIFII